MLSCNEHSLTASTLLYKFWQACTSSVYLTRLELSTYVDDIDDNLKVADNAAAASSDQSAYPEAKLSLAPLSPQVIVKQYMCTCDPMLVARLRRFRCPRSFLGFRIIISSVVSRG